MKIIPLSFHDAARTSTLFLAFFKRDPLKKEEIFKHFSSRTQRVLRKFFEKEFRGEEGEIKSLWLPEGVPVRIVLFGLGERSGWNERKIHLVPRRFVQYAKKEKIEEFATAPYQSPLGMGVKIFAINALMASFEFNRYKERPKGGWPEVKNVYLAADKKDLAHTQNDIREGTIIGEEVNACRELANTPGGDMTPTKLAEAARAMGKRTGIRVRVLDETTMKRLGMGGVLGVARGSDEKPRFIILEYRRGEEEPARSGRGSSRKAGRQKPLALVGKGVTFDTGGLNLKQEDHIYEMHMDMSGGAAVIHGMAAVARLKLPLHIIGVIPAVENMPSGSSYRPGDLLKTMSGKTIEVLNTDAEGRIILADALYYCTKYVPGLMVDFATLTGAAQVALGKFMSVLFVNKQRLTEPLIEIGATSGDYVWPMPLWDEYFENIRGTFGDIMNSGKQGSGGGAISGAKFLEQFVGNTPWAHIDIAPRMTALENEYLSKGASGVGVRYIVELAKEYPRLIT